MYPIVNTKKGTKNVPKISEKYQKCKKVSKVKNVTKIFTFWKIDSFRSKNNFWYFFIKKNSFLLIHIFFMLKC